MSIGHNNPLPLPVRIPVFPLTGVLLMPFGHLPLNVFEDRYLRMVDDALGQGRVFGVIQPLEPHADPVPDEVSLYSVGTLGRIIQFSEPGDGTYAITLEGLSRFRTKDVRLENRGYRTVHADYSEFLDDLSPTEIEGGPERAELERLMKAYFGAKELEADWDAVRDAPFEALVSSLAMSCPFQPGEKQALLESDDVHARAALLISLFAMSVEGGGAGGTRH